MSTTPAHRDRRPTTPVDEIANAHLAAVAAADPLLATEIGLDDSVSAARITDFSADALDDRAREVARALAALDAAPITDAVDRVTVATMRAALRRDLALTDADERVGECNVIASPLQAIRDVFDLMPTGTDDEQATFIARLRAVPAAIDTVIAGLDRRILNQRTHSGPPLTERQVNRVARQAEHAADSIAANIDLVVAQTLRADLDSALQQAHNAFTGLADHLRTSILPTAVTRDAVGRERYSRFLPHYLGADIDVDDAYAWALDQLEEIIATQQRLAVEITGRSDATIAEALEALNADPRYRITDAHRFVSWMQELSDRAVAELAGVHFDIPDRLTRLECRLAPSATGIIYYTQPSSDLSRPGRMWWSVPPEQTVFHTWQETTTVYHEGVPGHHLQLGSAIVDDNLNDWRKLVSFTSGHGEGWALYAERLMADLGRLDDPGDRMGMLDAQRLRVARVIVDIGVHCELPAPPHLGGTWNAETAWEFLSSSVAMDRTVLRFELDRYLGWPGQAPSYALGQRVWEQTRDGALRAHPTWSLRDFHRNALALGGVALDVLAEEMTRPQ